jgi:Protein of unknown function (DUF3102)
MNGTAVASNRLAALAVEIEAAHQAAYGAARTALEHAAECGRLLLEAKAAVEHGGWLPWLRQNTTVGPRQAQRDMRVASRWGELEGKCVSETHLTLTEAVALLAGQKDEEPEPGSWGWAWEWAEAQLEGPFNAFDFADRKQLRWLTMKLLHKVGLPPTVDMALGMGAEYDLPLLRAAPDDELIAGLRLMAGVVKGDAGPAMDVQGTDLLEAWVTLKMTAQRIFVLLWDEVERREKRDDDTLEREAKVVLARLEEILQQRQATLDELKQRHATGEPSSPWQPEQPEHGHHRRPRAGTKPKEKHDDR